VIAAEGADERQYALGDLLRYFLRLGAVGFGGPIALCGYMQRDLVERRRWIAPEDYKQGLALAQLAPGPLAAQLAIYLGWVRARTLGATLVALAFVLPSFLMVLVLSALYVQYGGLAWMQGAFYGIGAAVIAIIARSAWKLVRMTLARDWLLWSIFLAAGTITAWTESENIWLFLLCGTITILVKAPPRLLLRSVSAASLFSAGGVLTGAHGAASVGTVGKLFWFFLKAGAFVFGSGLAIVPFLYGGVVVQFHWLSERQFLDAVAVAMITPGPVVITAAFVGYLVAGPVGATLASLAVFAPPYLIVVLGAPWYRRFAQNRKVKAFVQGVTAAAVGAIAGATFILGRRALVDLPTTLIAAAVLALLLIAKKTSEPLLIVAAGIAGLLMWKGH